MASRQNLVPVTERRAATAAKKAAIDAEYHTRKAAAETELVAAHTAASDALKDEDDAAAEADTQARIDVAKAFYLQTVKLAAALLEQETRAAALEYRAKYRALQAEALKYHGAELQLMPLMAVGQVIMTRDPAAKSRIARVETVASPYVHCAATENAVAHRALMAESPNDAEVREAILALEQKLVLIGREAAPGAFSDEIWQGVRCGLNPYELDELSRDLSQPEQRARLRAAAKEPSAPAGRWGQWIQKEGAAQAIGGM
jgi:hypothetical protein